MDGERPRTLRGEERGWKGELRGHFRWRLHELPFPLALRRTSLGFYSGDVFLFPPPCAYRSHRPFYNPFFIPFLHDPVLSLSLSSLLSFSHCLSWPLCLFQPCPFHPMYTPNVHFLQTSSPKPTDFLQPLYPVLSPLFPQLCKAHVNAMVLHLHASQLHEAVQDARCKQTSHNGVTCLLLSRARALVIPYRLRFALSHLQPLCPYSSSPSSCSIMQEPRCTADKWGRDRDRERERERERGGQRAWLFGFLCSPARAFVYIYNINSGTKVFGMV